MVTMQRDVQTEILRQVLVLTKPEHIGVVTCMHTKHVFANDTSQILTNKIQVLINRF